MTTTVRLSWAEAQTALIAGGQRRLVQMFKNGNQHRWNRRDEDGWTVDIEAAGAEIALARALERYWNPAPYPDHDGDVGAGIQVRHTTREDGSLILHPEDEDEHRFYLVTGKMPTFTIVGSVEGAEGKRNYWWREDTGRPAYFIPQGELQPIDEKDATTMV